ncbi:aminotransferase-like domain-containing protein [Goodfellowiella coeruleoviolacea]|uniref:DNA-binding transcriptional regulator, MocR family, contains an aminotransferase domain n=1 Tax=Goodfellowiella coeruleoviolacea TaxID=334858 RepID=A0AAE3KHA7_9PSEU|nr:PLP-dependent aminotransferase family protein [Goodfellowiella coeruleoviolacea]MCP2166264.1 DNA-binding transcriptional regulator, MocR family, contains an aminotransferase domain [Goodfellowiella coeruleoviolacea]
MTPDALIPFTRGAPSLDIIDTQGLAEATQKAFSTDPAGTFGYGTAGGYLPLREWIAEQHGVDVDQVLVTNGSMQADAFLFQTLVRPGDDVVVEAPTYDRTLLSLRQRGATVHAVDLETDGVDVAALRSLVDGGVRPALAHIIPNFQNPAGYTLSAAKRTQLLALAAEHGFVVFEDDPYVSIRFEGEPLPTMLSQDTADTVVYASSFSKTVAPGLRCGYLVGPKKVLAEVIKLATNTYISPNMVSQSIVNEYCRSGLLDRSISVVRTALRERRDALVAALRRELPEARFTPPQGGYFMWVELPEGVLVDRLAPVAREHGVAFVNGTDFLLDGGHNAVRLAFAGLSPEQIDTGITRLAAAVRALAG